MTGREHLPSVAIIVAAVLMFSAGLAIAVALWLGLVVGGVLLFCVGAMALPAENQSAREIARRSHNP